MAECPVVAQAELTSSAALMLYDSLRKLRRLAVRCKQCPNCKSCEGLDYWNTSINTSIARITAEWNG